MHDLKPESNSFRRYSTPIPPSPRVLTLVAGFLVAVFMIFPQVPIQFRYTSIMALLLTLFNPRIIFFKPLQYLFFYTIAISMVGLFVVIVTGDGTIPNVLFGLRALSISMIVLLFIYNAQLKWFFWLNSAFLFFGTFGMVLDFFKGPAWALLPFPIFSERHMFFIGAAQLVSERSGGFTFEAGVIGGMTAFFMAVNLAGIYLRVNNPRLPISSFTLMLMVTSVASGVVTFGLAKTKSGALILAMTLVAMACAVIISGKRGGGAFSRLAVIVGVLIIAMLLPVAYAAVANTSMGFYIQKEIDFMYLLVKQGFTKNDGAGLNTRIVCAQMALYSLPYRPIGVGMSDGYVLVSPILDKVEPTAEMEMLHNMGQYLGFKGAILNMIGHGGVIAILFLSMLFARMRSMLSSSCAIGAPVVFVCLLSASLSLGFTVELLPYLEMLIWISGLCLLIERDMYISASLPIKQ